MMSNIFKNYYFSENKIEMWEIYMKMPLSFTYNFPQVSVHASIFKLGDTWIFGNGFNGVFTGE
ncbi:MAG: hypothetical protein ACKO99_22160 [Dolichospermum sp.]